MGPCRKRGRRIASSQEVGWSNNKAVYISVNMPHRQDSSLQNSTILTPSGLSDTAGLLG